MKKRLLQIVFCGMCAFAPLAKIHAATLAITSVNTSSGTSISPATPSTVVEIHGSKFAATQETNYIGFCAPHLATICSTSANGSIVISSWSDAMISLCVPADNVVPLGSYLVTLFRLNGELTDKVSAQSYGYAFSDVPPGPIMSILTGGASGVPHFA
jgi:hypothetical protein